MKSKILFTVFFITLSVCNVCEISAQKVYVTPSGTKYHCSNCRHVSSSSSSSTYALLDCRDNNDVVGCEVANPKKKDVGDHVLYPDKPIIYAWPDDAEQMFITIYEYDAWPTGGRHCDQCVGTNVCNNVLNPTDPKEYNSECGSNDGTSDNWCAGGTYVGCINKYRSRFRDEIWFRSCATTGNNDHIYRSSFVSPGYWEHGNPSGEDFYIRMEWFN